MYRNSSQFNLALILGALVWVILLLGGCVASILEPASMPTATSTLVEVVFKPAVMERCLVRDLTVNNEGGELVLFKDRLGDEGLKVSLHPGEYVYQAEAYMGAMWPQCPGPTNFYVSEIKGSFTVGQVGQVKVTVGPASCWTCGPVTPEPSAKP